MVGSLASAGGSLAAAGAKMAYKAVAGSADAVDDAVDKKGFGFKKGKGDADSGGGKGKKGKKGKKESSSMFGGLDLGAVESAIQGPMGPPEPEQEVKGGVYKQIFAVNEKMLSSLMNIENSIRMLLSIEYEKIQGMMSDDRQTTIDEGETDEPEGEKKKGLLGRAAGGLGGMLGSAYAKAKGGLGSNLFKALGIGALIIAFKKYPDQIREGVKSLLIFFKDTYDYFTADDFTFAMFKEDLIKKFIPQVGNMASTFFSWLWNRLKVLVNDTLGISLFRTTGDVEVRSSAKKIERTQTALESTQAATTGTDNLGFFTKKLKSFNYGDNKDKDTGVTENQRTSISNNALEQLQEMFAIAQKSGGAIQWTGMPEFGGFGKNTLKEAIGDTKIPISAIMNSKPIVINDVVSREDLNDIVLNRAKGYNETTSDDDKSAIDDNNALIANLTREKLIIQAGGNSKAGLVQDIGKKGEAGYRPGLDTRIANLQGLNSALGATPLSVGEYSKTSGALVSAEPEMEKILQGTTGVSEPTKSLMSVSQIAAKAAKDAEAAAILAARSNMPGGNVTSMTNNTDMSSNQVNMHSLNANPTNGTVQADRARELAAR